MKNAPRSARTALALTLTAALSCTTVASAVAATPSIGSATHVESTNLIDHLIVNSRHSMTVPDEQKSVTTEDGTTVTLKKLGERLYRTAPLTGNPLSHDALINLQGIATVKGAPENSAHTLTVGYLMGCQVDASYPGQLRFDPSVQVQLPSPLIGFGHNSEVTDYDKWGVPNWDKLQLPKTGVWFGWTTGINITYNLNYRVRIRPGRINKVPLASLSFHGNRTSWADFQNLQLHIDGCPGNVSVRSYVEFVDGARIPAHYRVPRNSESDGIREMKADKAPSSGLLRFAKAAEKLKHVDNKSLRQRPEEIPNADTTVPGVDKNFKDDFETYDPDRFETPTIDPLDDFYDDTLSSHHKSAENIVRKRADEDARLTPTQPSRVKDGQTVDERRARDKQTQTVTEKELTEVGQLNDKKRRSPYGDTDFTSNTIEGIKFTIHGGVRWLSSLLPQTQLRQDWKNRKHAASQQIEPYRQYGQRLNSARSTVPTEMKKEFDFLTTQARKPALRGRKTTGQH